MFITIKYDSITSVGLALNVSLKWCVLGTMILTFRLFCCHFRRGETRWSQSIVLNLSPFIRHSIKWSRVFFSVGVTTILIVCNCINNLVLKFGYTDHLFQNKIMLFNDLKYPYLLMNKIALQRNHKCKQ